MTQPDKEFVYQLTDWQNRLFGYLVTLLSNPHDARAVLQETNLILWQKVSDYETGTDFGAWARKCAYYQALAFLRDRHLFDDDVLALLANEDEGVSNLPSGVSATFTNNPIIGGASVLTLTASSNVISGTTNVTVIATAGLLSHTKTISLTLIGPTNTPPTLAVITNRTVNVGQTVAFSANATDTNQPPQTLTFALLARATNATLNASNSAFSFRPLVTQANSTNNFTLTVSDNGTPSLSAAQSFSVVVSLLSAPTASHVSAAVGQFSLSVSGQSGPDYAVEISTNLAQWSNVFVTNSPALPFNWMTAATNSPQRFYRIKLGPPLP